MNKYKKIGLWVIVALQFNAALFFVSAIVLDTYGLQPKLLNWASRDVQNYVHATGLVLGVVLGWTALRMSLMRAQNAERKLRLCAGEFAELMEEHFADWRLTPAERDVALFLVKGLSTREIAELRGTSEGTVKAQTNAIYRKAAVAGRPQLLSLFIEDLMDDVILPGAKAERAPDIAA
jgi:DNA-binding CsgD family transcriptional regulator